MSEIKSLWPKILDDIAEREFVHTCNKCGGTDKKATGYNYDVCANCGEAVFNWEYKEVADELK